MCCSWISIEMVMVAGKVIQKRQLSVGLPGLEEGKNGMMILRSCMTMTIAKF